MLSCDLIHDSWFFDLVDTFPWHRYHICLFLWQLFVHFLEWCQCCSMFDVVVRVHIHYLFLYNSSLIWLVIRLCDFGCGSLLFLISLLACARTFKGDFRRWFEHSVFHFICGIRIHFQLRLILSHSLRHVYIHYFFFLFLDCDFLQVYYLDVRHTF